jgi:aspartate/methionine/tyrosine aminotransferase
MLNFDQISYLRWVRGQAAAEPAIVPLTYSGMLAPSVDWLTGIDGEELVTFDGSDHPALAGRMAIEWGLDPSQVVLAPGTHWSILLALMERLSEAPGPVVVEEPTYEPLWRIPEALGVPVLRWPRPREREFALDPEALEGLVAQKPSVFLFSHPHNPGGAVLGDDDRALLTEFQQRTGALLISDEVYLEFESDPASATLLGTCADMLIIRSFTKVMGLGPIRCSAIAGSRERIARLARAADYAHVLLPAPTRVVAERAWDHREELWDRARAAARAGRAEVEAFLGRATGLVEAYLPGSGIICFPRLTDSAHEAAVAMARRRGVTVDAGILPGLQPAAAVWIEDLRRRQGIQLTPGEFFGDDRAFRLGFGLDAELVGTGLQGIESYLLEAMEEA